MGENNASGKHFILLPVIITTFSFLRQEGRIKKYQGLRLLPSVSTTVSPPPGNIIVVRVPTENDESSPLETQQIVFEMFHSQGSIFSLYKIVNFFHKFQGFECHMGGLFCLKMESVDMLFVLGCPHGIPDPYV